MSQHAYDHLALYATPSGPGPSVDKTIQNQRQGKILKWKAFDLDTFDAYKAAIAKHPRLLQAYILNWRQ
jgi:hypothetical protein